MKRMTDSEIQTEVNLVQGVLATRFKGFKTRVAHAVAKALLLRGWYMYNGRGCTPVAKSVGCGVYEVWLAMEAYQERVVAEKRELDGRITKLVEFVGSVKFQELPEDERGFLGMQLSAMDEYSEALFQRILKWQL